MDFPNISDTSRHVLLSADKQIEPLHGFRVWTVKFKAQGGSRSDQRPSVNSRPLTENPNWKAPCGEHWDLKFAFFFPPKQNAMVPDVHSPLKIILFLSQVSRYGWRSLCCGSQMVLGVGGLWPRFGNLGRRAIRNLFQGKPSAPFSHSVGIILTILIEWHHFVLWPPMLQINNQNRHVIFPPQLLDERSYFLLMFPWDVVMP